MRSRLFGVLTVARGEWGVLALVVLCYLVLLARGITIRTDSYVYWASAGVGEPAYVQHCVRQVGGGVLPYLYAPPVLAAMRPLAWLSWEAAYWVCGLASLAGVMTWGWLLGGRRGCILSLLFPGSAFCVVGGNIEPWLWVLSLTRVGLLFGGLVKPVWWVLLLFDRRRWTWGQLACAGVVGGLLLGSVPWWGGWLGALGMMTDLGTKAWNLSLANLWRWGFPVPVVAVSLVVWVATYYFWRRRMLTDVEAATVAWLGQPLLRVYYLPFLMRWLQDGEFGGVRLSESRPAADADGADLAPGDPVRLYPGCGCCGGGQQ